MTAVIPFDMSADLETKADKPREFFYDLMRGRYWTQDDRQVWISQSMTEVTPLLELAGFDPRAPVQNPKSVERQLLKLRMEKNVDYAGPLAGYQMGQYTVLGNRLLVTTSPRLIEPKKGDWPVLRKLMENLFTESEEERAARVQESGDERPCIDQLPYVLGWLRIGLQSLYANKRHPGQALVLAGDRDCGKSLFQSILTEIFGGRGSKPYKAMTDSTNFNGDMFTAEHLIIGDEACRIDMKSRKAFATQIKGVVAETVQRMEAKHKDAISLTPFWRLSISLNLEPENIMVLPPVDEDIADKLILCKAYKRPLPWAMNGPDDREAFWAKLMEELPALVYHVLHEYEIPEDLRSRRFGVRYYHHPEILGVIDALTGEERLLDLVDQEIFAGTAAARPWVGSALELELKLKHKDSVVSTQARELLSSSNVCGSYLGKLKKRKPGRVRQKRSAKERAWVLYPEGWDHVLECVPGAAEAAGARNGPAIVAGEDNGPPPSAEEEEWARATGRVAKTGEEAS